ncbi:MAG: biotin--[acetyl-CoA-carboxylase] ligase [Spirochaetales bacterium]
MVNSITVIQHRQRLLEILRAKESPVSIQLLAAELGISRIALWKLVKKLQDLGYPIQRVQKGYFLPPERDPDLLCPWELGPFGIRTVWFRQCGSTMQEAKRLIHAPLKKLSDQRENPLEKESLHLQLLHPDPYYLVAETQTAGRGRFSRRWESPAGGMYLTLILSEPIPYSIVARYPLLACSTLLETLFTLYPSLQTDRTPFPLHLKWPNDIYAGNRKLAGLLVDMEIEGDTVTHLYLGMGLNVYSRNLPKKAITLAELLGKSQVSRRKILTSYLQNLNRHFKEPFLKGAIAHWKQYSLVFGKTVKVIFPGAKKAGLAPISGTALDLSPKGELLVKSADGIVHSIGYGGSLV